MFYEGCIETSQGAGHAGGEDPHHLDAKDNDELDNGFREKANGLDSLLDWIKVEGNGNQNGF